MKESCGNGEMTLDEAIAHLDETLASKKDWSCEKCKDEHIQLRKWLAELKSLEGRHNALVDKYNALADRYNRQGQALKLELEENRALVIENKQLKEKLKGEE